MTSIEHHSDESRFVTVVDGTEAELTYVLRDGVLHITHTGVPGAIGGRGIAGDLVQFAFDYARDNGLKVAPDCTYAQAWIQRHADYQNLVN